MESWAHLYGVENSGEEMRLFGKGHSEYDMRVYRGIRSEAYLSGAIVLLSINSKEIIESRTSNVQ